MIKHRTKEWYMARIGKFTASNFHSLLARPADKNATISKSALNCIEKAAAQLYFNAYYERPDSDSTCWGLKYENRAIQLFSERIGKEVADIGYIEHPLINSVGATPDARVIDISNPDDLIIAQIKCPYNAQYHKDYLNKILDTQSLKKKKSKYYWQIQGEMWVSGAVHSYFVSYDPRLSNLNDCLHFVEIQRDEESILKVEEAVLQAIQLRDSILEDFRSGRRQPKHLYEYY